MIKLPIWARKPKHKENIVATSKGWVVERTGEVIHSVKNLPERLESLNIYLRELLADTEPPMTENLYMSGEFGEPEIAEQVDSGDIHDDNGEDSDTGTLNSDDTLTSDPEAETLDNEPVSIPVVNLESVPEPETGFTEEPVPTKNLELIVSIENAQTKEEVESLVKDFTDKFDKRGGLEKVKEKAIALVNGA